MANELFTARAKLDITVTAQDIDDILCTALEGGVCHWSNRVTVVGEPRGEYASDQVSRGGSLDFFVGRKIYRLDTKKLLKGLEKWLSEDADIGAATTRKDDGKRFLDPGGIYANDADCIVQYSLFDELVYA